MKIFLLAVISVALSAQSIQITDGIKTDQVFQREQNGKTDIPLKGTASDAEGKQVEIRVTRGILPNFGFNWKKYGLVTNGAWEAAISGLPTGGPYKLEARIQGSKNVTQIEPFFVGDLWVLGGQSNMEGVGNLEFVHPPDDKVRMIDMVEEKWQAAIEPLHNLPGAVDKVHWRVNEQKQPERLTGDKLAEYNRNRKKGAGLGIAFGAAYVKHGDAPVGLIPAAHGGTSMDQWDPARYNAASPGDSLYGSMLRRVKVASHNGKVRGVLWYQGESDASLTAAPLFKGKFERFVAKVREDLKDPTLPFLYVQIGRFINTQNQDVWNRIQEDQRTAEESIPNSTVFAAVDSDLDDIIHVGTEDLKRIGVNMGRYAAGKAKKGPRMASVNLNNRVVRVNFVEANGKLTSKDRINGFTLHGPNGDELPLIFKQEVDPRDTQSVLIHLIADPPAGSVLRYGAGKNPYCNLRDEFGFGALVFGPMQLN